MDADNGDRQNKAGQRELHSAVQYLLVQLCVCKDHSLDVTFKLSIFEVFSCKFSHLTWDWDLFIHNCIESRRFMLPIKQAYT